MGGVGCMGTEHTPMPAFTWMGMLESATVCLTKVTDLARFQGKDLAQRAGLTESYLSRIENSSSAPPISTLSRIAEILGTDITFLFQPEPENTNDNPDIVVVRNEEIDFDNAFIIDATNWLCINF